MEPDKELVSQFKNSGVSEIPEDNSSVRDIILTVLKKYPDKWFTQKDFRDNLKDVVGIGHSNPYINGTLRKLAAKNEIQKETRGRRAFYRATSS